VHELESAAAKIEAEIYEECDSEVSTKVIGERVSDALKSIDHVAFVRFASVYRDFKDVKEFLSELIPLLRAQDSGDIGSDGGGADKPEGTVARTLREAAGSESDSCSPTGEETAPGGRRRGKGEA
jgi:hypothetical protein